MTLWSGSHATWAREINDLSWGALAILNLLAGIILVLLKQFRWKDLAYIFLVGTLVEFALEFSLLVSGIRLGQGHWTPSMMVVNALTEFNCGIVTMYLIWNYLNHPPRSFPFEIFYFPCLSASSFREYRNCMFVP